MHERRSWTKHEDQMIKQSVQNNPSLKWKSILTWIKSRDNTFSRTSKQIRQRWKFRLDPNLNNQPWNSQQEQILFKSHLHKGSKWKQIKKLLPGRSQQSIKNHFYMTFRKSLRRVTKILGAKNSTIQSREIKSHVLTKLIESLNQRAQKRQSVYRLFNLHKVKSGQCKKMKIWGEDLQVFRELLDDIIKYNQLYAINKKQGKKVLEERLKNLKSESCVIDKIGEKSTVFGSSSIKEEMEGIEIKSIDQFEDSVCVIKQSEAEEIEEILQQQNSFLICKIATKIQEDEGQQAYQFMVQGNNIYQAQILNPEH